MDRPRVRGDLGFGQVRGELQDFEALLRDALALGALGFGFREHAFFDGAIEHAVAGAAGGFAVAVGAAHLGRLR